MIRHLEPRRTALSSVNDATTSPPSSALPARPQSPNHLTNKLPTQDTRGVLPLASAVILLIISIGLIVLGWLLASPGMVAAGAVVFVGVVGDGIHAGVIDAKRPLPVLRRVATPNPATVGATMRVQLLPPSYYAPIDHDTELAETLPNELVSKMTLVDTVSEHGMLKVTYDLAFAKRGAWTLGPYTAKRVSPFGFWSVGLADDSTLDVMVWPRTATVSLFHPPSDREGPSGGHISLQPRPDNTTLRAYAPGDDLRRIHWKSSAKRGELISRAEEPTDSDHVWVGLIVPIGTLGSRRELAVELAASWCLAAHEAGNPVDLAVGGETHHGDLHTLLDILARASDADLARPLPRQSPEGVSLLILGRSSNKSQSTGDLVHAPRSGSHNKKSALAAILSDSIADVAQAESLGWKAVRLGEKVGLEQACGAITVAGESMK